MNNSTNNVVLSIQNVGNSKCTQMEIDDFDTAELYTFTKDEAVRLASNLLQVALKIQ